MKGEDDGRSLMRKGIERPNLLKPGKLKSISAKGNCVLFRHWEMVGGLNFHVNSQACQALQSSQNIVAVSCLALHLGRTSFLKQQTPLSGKHGN